jgi:hypothetical protein
MVVEDAGVALYRYAAGWSSPVPAQPTKNERHNATDHSVSGLKDFPGCWPTSIECIGIMRVQDSKSTTNKSKTNIRQSPHAFQQQLGSLSELFGERLPQARLLA